MITFRSKFMMLAAVSAFGISNVAQAQRQELPKPTDLSNKAGSAREDVTQAPGSTRQAVIEAADANANAPSVASTDPKEVIEVTGSRLYDGDVTSKKIVIDREEIKRRGVTSVEDLIRTLPQNVATIGAITNERGKGPLSNRGGASGVSPLGSLGVSAANLGGTGAANTLVLLNGRRVAGAAGIEDGFANLNGIPLSAIERVEIIPSGAAAVYGADAMSGVINFILRKDYRGVTLGSQTLFSNNGADTARFNAYAGFSWGSGSLSGTADFRRQHPIVNSKTGFVTTDYSSRFNGDPSFNQRSVLNGLQPGAIDVSSGAFDPATNTYVFNRRFLTLPAGFNGRPTRADFITVGPDALRDYVPRFAGALNDTLGFTLNFDQKITDRFKVFANGLYTRNKNRQQQSGQGLFLTLAPGQYYNPFPAGQIGGSFSPGTNVYYYPESEAAAGVVTPSQIRNSAEQWNINAGLTYDFGKNTRLTAIYTTSRSKTTASGSQLQSLVTIDANPNAPGTYRCYNRDILDGRVPAADLAARQAIVDRQCRALTSTDPAIAFNPFKSSVGGPGGSISDFVYQYATENRSSRLEQVEARLTGTLLTLPAGGLSYAIGGEYSDDGADSREINAVTGAAGSRSRYAFFAETSLPILGNGYDLPFAHALTFNIAARRDTSRIEGPVGTVGNVFYVPGVTPLRYETNKFSRITPSFGVNYQPVQAVTILAKWGRGFQPPPYTQLFSPAGVQAARRQPIIGDTRYTCTTDCIIRGDPTSGYYVPSVIAPNPDLRPQTSRQESYTLAWQPQGGLQGLNASATFNRTRIRDQFARPIELGKLLNRDQLYGLANLFPRGANGKITQYNQSVVNLIGADYRSMTYEVGYVFMTGIGNFEPRLTMVDNLKSETRGLPDSPAIETLGRLQGPDDYRLVGSLTYARDHVSVTLWGYHTPSYANDYLVDYNNGEILDTQDGFARSFRVGAYTTFDLTASFTAFDRLRANSFQSGS